MQLVLEWNLFTFHNAAYLQKVGVAMGTHPAPDYSDIFMARKIDKKIWSISEKLKENVGSEKDMLLLLKRFLDDLFLIFQGTTKQLHTLLNKIIEIHPAIKFTMDHTTNELESDCDKCDCSAKKSILFLDTSCSIENRKI